MANVNSNVAKAQLETNGVKLYPVDFGGRVRIATGRFTAETALPAGTVINLAKLPKGARLLPSSKIYFEGGQGATLTVEVGDEKQGDRYFAAAAVGATATSKALDANALGNYVFPQEMFVTVTTGVIALAVGKAVAFELFYCLD